MKIKVNLSKETISLKGLTPLEFSVIEALLNHTRMGMEQYDGGASAVPFTFAHAVEDATEDLSTLDMPDVSVCAMPSDEIEGLSVLIDAPTLEVYVD